MPAFLIWDIDEEGPETGKIVEAGTAEAAARKGALDNDFSKADLRDGDSNVKIGVIDLSAATFITVELNLTSAVA